MNVDYSRHYRHWHDESPAHRDRMLKYLGPKLTPYLPGSRDDPILDVGCGMGFALETLRSLGFTQVAGIETSPQQSAASRQRGFDVACVEDSVAWLREHRDRYALILLLDVLEHVPREAQIPFVTALHGALRPGGRLLCSVPNANSTVGGRQFFGDWTHHSSFTEISLDFVLHHGGFREIRVMADDGPAKPLPWLPLWRRRWWYVRGVFRTVRRLQLMSEYGAEEGRRIPLSPNLLATATR